MGSVRFLPEIYKNMKPETDPFIEKFGPVRGRFRFFFLVRSGFQVYILIPRKGGKVGSAFNKKKQDNKINMKSKNIILHIFNYTLLTMLFKEPTQEKETT